MLVTVHGGSWATGVSKPVMRALAGELVRRGNAVWNIEYRRVGEGGGWPATFLDVAAAVDHLPELAGAARARPRHALRRFSGGHLALWAASRPRLPAGAPGAGPLVTARAAVSAAGVDDLAQTYREAPGGAVGRLRAAGPTSCPSATRSPTPSRWCRWRSPSRSCTAPTTRPCRCAAAATTPRPRGRAARPSSWSRSRTRRARIAATSSRAAPASRRCSVGSMPCAARWLIPRPVCGDGKWLASDGRRGTDGHSAFGTGPVVTWRPGAARRRRTPQRPWNQPARCSC